VSLIHPAPLPVQGHIQLALQASIARVTIRHAPRFNAMSRAMWRELCLSAFKPMPTCVAW
jgi:hypothetical protein